jgi:hypothetical protein
MYWRRLGSRRRYAAVPSRARAPAEFFSGLDDDSGVHE